MTLHLRRERKVAPQPAMSIPLHHDAISLTLVERMVLICHRYKAGMPIKEIQDLTDLSYGTVRTIESKLRGMGYQLPWRHGRGQGIAKARQAKGKREHAWRAA